MSGAIPGAFPGRLDLFVGKVVLAAGILYKYIQNIHRKLYVLMRNVMFRRYGYIGCFLYKVYDHAWTSVEGTTRILPTFKHKYGFTAVLRPPRSRVLCSEAEVPK